MEQPRMSVGGPLQRQSVSRVSVSGNKGAQVLGGGSKIIQRQSVVNRGPVIQGATGGQGILGSSRIIGTNPVQNQTQFVGQNKLAAGSVLRTTEWQDASHLHQKIQGETVLEQVPYERNVIEYEPVTRIEYVAVEKKIQDYYTIEHITEHIPQVRYETKIDYVDEIIYETVPQVRTEYVEEKRTDYVIQKRQELVPEKRIDYVTKQRTDYVEQKIVEQVQVEKSEWVPYEVEEQVPVERTEYITREYEEQVPVERTEMVPIITEEQIPVERVEYKPVERQEEIVDYVPVKRSVVKHPDGRVTGLEGLPPGVNSGLVNLVGGSTIVNNQPRYIQPSTVLVNNQPNNNNTILYNNPNNYTLSNDQNRKSGVNNA